MSVVAAMMCVLVAIFGVHLCRLAIVDQDWAHVRAVDLLAGLNSFVPKVCSILQQLYAAVTAAIPSTFV
jgi:hypothetical protein